jgi:hypothetical protein
VKRLELLGHINEMDQTRLAKKIFKIPELETGRYIGRPKMR